MDKKGINYGGMAVIEGVTMRGPRITSMAVRKSDGTIEMYTEPAGRQAEKFPVLKWPLLRGVYALIESLITGMRMLNKSANLAMDEEEEEISSWELLLTGFFCFPSGSSAFYHIARHHCPFLPEFHGRHLITECFGRNNKNYLFFAICLSYFLR